MTDFTATSRDTFSSQARRSFASNSREQAFSAGNRFSAIPIFITDEAGNILTDESGAPLLTEAGWTGAPKQSNGRDSFTAKGRP